MKLLAPARRSLPVLLGLALVPSARAGVLVVDAAGGPGSDFPAIQDAVDAAGEGDTVLVRDGSYGGFVVDGKSLWIVADGAAVEIRPSSGLLVVRNLSPAQEVLVRGLCTKTALSVTDCGGAVWLEDLCFEPSSGYCGSGGLSGGEVQRSERVTLTRCRFVGSADYGGFTPPVSGAGLWALDASVQLYASELEGARGADKLWYGAQPGGPGLRVEGSTVTLVGSELRGGGGGLWNNGSLLCATTHARGGPGVAFVGTAGVVRSAASTAVGGVTSLEPMCPGKTGPAGPAISGSGAIVSLPGFARGVEAASPVRGGETLRFELSGQPGETPLLVLSAGHEPLFLAGYGALLLVRPPIEETFVLGPLSASGAASLSFAVPAIGPATGALNYYAQAAFVDASPRVWLGGGTAVTLLDPTF